MRKAALMAILLALAPVSARAGTPDEPEVIDVQGDGVALRTLGDDPSLDLTGAWFATRREAGIVTGFAIFVRTAGSARRDSAITVNWRVAGTGCSASIWMDGPSEAFDVTVVRIERQQFYASLSHGCEGEDSSVSVPGLVSGRVNITTARVDMSITDNVWIAYVPLSLFTGASAVAYQEGATLEGITVSSIELLPLSSHTVDRAPDCDAVSGRCSPRRAFTLGS
ncbi:MAG TPA: hypothetical protein VGB52_00460 [Actinomycetota bacterium]